MCRLHFFFSPVHVGAANEDTECQSYAGEWLSRVLIKGSASRGAINQTRDHTPTLTSAADHGGDVVFIQLLAPRLGQRPLLLSWLSNIGTLKESCWEINPCTVAFLILTYVKDTTAEVTNQSRFQTININCCIWEYKLIICLQKKWFSVLWERWKKRVLSTRPRWWEFVAHKDRHMAAQFGAKKKGGKAKEKAQLWRISEKEKFLFFFCFFSDFSMEVWEETQVGSRYCTLGLSEPKSWERPMFGVHWEARWS